jgi:hypothetical protein
MNLCTKLELRTLLLELLIQKRLGQQVIVTDNSTGLCTTYTSINACARALGVNSSYIKDFSVVKKGKYTIRFVLD